MGVISGSEYIDRINHLHSEIWIEGKKIEGKVSDHPAFAGIMKSQAKLYDLQLKKLDTMTYLSSGEERIGLSFLEPKCKEDLEKRRLMIQEWARTSAGMLGRSPDYMNTALMAFAAAADIFADESCPFADNLRNLYERAQLNDFSFTHTFVNPQVNRSLSYLDDSSQIISAQTINSNSDGIIIKGARLLATQGGITDEILVFPANSHLKPEHAYAFSVPSNTPGIKYLCRESFRYKESTYDHPLSSQYDEIDTIVVFDNVTVPWERVFCYQNPVAASRIFQESSFYPLAAHQITARRIVKTEFLLGVADLLVDTINVGEFQHIQAKITELIIALETLKALLTASEVNAKFDKWGTMIPDFQPLSSAVYLYTKMYPGFCDILQQIGASGLITIPSEEDFSSEIKNDLDIYLQAANANAEERVRIFRLAWDICMSAFGSRQILYERYFFGDPVRMASGIYQGYPLDKCTGFVKNFLENQK